MNTLDRTTSEKINASFSGHETFPFRYTWMKKGVDTVRDDPTIFADDSATITLGVGKNMVRSIRHWCQVTQLIEFGGVDLNHTQPAQRKLTPPFQDMKPSLVVIRG